MEDAEDPASGVSLFDSVGEADSELEDDWGSVTDSLGEVDGVADIVTSLAVGEVSSVASGEAPQAGRTRIPVASNALTAVARPRNRFFTVISWHSIKPVLSKIR